MTWPTLTPATTLAEVFGPDVVYLPRRSPNLPGWSPPATGRIDFLTGLHLGIAGGLPYVACAATLCPAALDLYAEAGLPANAEVHRYREVGEYLALVTRLVRQGRRLAAQRVHPDAEIPPEAAFTPPALLRRLNDKGRMEDLVPVAWLPRRRTVAVASLPGNDELLEAGPVVLKVATEAPNGGGHGVWICRSREELDRARLALNGENRLVLEELLPIRTSVCVHAVVFPDGRVALMGLAEEIVAGARWLGNWQDARGDRIPADALDAVQAIVATAGAMGYRGIVGVDVALLCDGTWRVLDLNFRVNGSTPGAWLRAAITATRGAGVLKGRTWTAAAFDALLRAARDAVRRGTLIPLGSYDPAAASIGGRPALAGLLLGGSREEIEEEDRRLARQGLT